MDRWNELLERFWQKSGWRDLVLMKLCICAVGVLVGLVIPWRSKRAAAWVASLVFAATYVPLMEKLLSLLLGDKVPIEEIYH